MASRRQIRLPRQWPRHVKSGILHLLLGKLMLYQLSYSRSTPR
jgi:hypothetical protein